MVDTMIASAWLGRAVSARRSRWAPTLEPAGWILPFVVVAEMRFGARVANWRPSRASVLERLVANTQVAPPLPEVIDAYVELRNWCVSNGHGLGAKDHEADRWVAATAIAGGLPLATDDGIWPDRNRGLFRWIRRFRVLGDELIMSTDRDTAIRIARRFVLTQIEPGIGQPVVLTTAREFPTCWVVGFNTKAYWETRSARHALAGGGPLIIDKATGELSVASSAAPLKDQIEGEELSRIDVPQPSSEEDPEPDG